jgi:hypothetical protein
LKKQKTLSDGRHLGKEEELVVSPVLECGVGRRRKEGGGGGEGFM